MKTWNHFKKSLLFFKKNLAPEEKDKVIEK